MPACDLVVAHGGHGTLMWALAAGRPVVICPAAGDMAESAARVDRAGVGVRLPSRLCTPRGVRLAVGRALGRPALRERAERVAAWIASHDGGARAASEIECWLSRRGRP